MKFLLPLLGCVAALGLTLTLMPGCEDNPSTDAASVPTLQSTGDFSTIDQGGDLSSGFSITPSDELVTSTYYQQQGAPLDLIGLQISFSASGGEPPYTDWSIDSTTIATISQSGVATLVGGIGSAQITATDSRGRVATAKLTTQYSVSSLPGLVMSPASMTFTSSITNGTPPIDLVGDSVTFQVAGGVPPYTFSVSSLGTLTQLSSSSVRFTINQAVYGTAIVSVKDSASQLTESTVTTQ